MSEKTLKTRIIHKHDIEDNWLKATSFIPKQGELIVYDIDDAHQYERFKIGDGIKNVNDLPFATDDKVDKVDGKQLSTNDYTTAEKTKLAEIEDGANAYTHPAYAARTGKPTDNQTPAFGGTATVSQVTSDGTGHVTGMTDRTITIPSTLSNGTGTAGLIKTSSTVTSNSGYTACPVISGVPYYKDTNTTYSAATTSANGLMSSSDKTKLDGIASGANAYTHPGYTAKSQGLYKVTVDDTGHVSAATAVAKSDITGLGIPAQDTTSFTITAAADDDDVVVLAGTNGTNKVTYKATHAKKGPSSTYTSGNTTTSISGSGGSGTIKVPQITVDTYGHVTAAADESVTVTLPTIPTSLKNPNELTVGSKTYDGSTAVTIAASDLGLSNALHFIGTTTTALSDGATTSPITVSGNSVVPTSGDVVLYSNKEFIWTDSLWEELGDESSHALKTIKVSAGDGLTGGGDLTANRTVAHSVPTGAAAESKGSTASRTYIKTVTTDKFGHVTDVTTGTETVTDTNTAHAHTAGTGLSVSGSGGTSGTTTYSLKQATADEIGGVKVSSVNSAAVTVNSESATAGRYYPVELNSDGKAIVNVPWTDNNTTYSVATQSANGLMSASDKKKLDTNVVTLDGTQTITGVKTFNAPTNVASTEQVTAWFNTANGGRIGFGKESANSGTGIFFDQVSGTRRLNFRASAAAGAMVWEQPEQGAALYVDLGAKNSDYHRVQFPSSAGTLALVSQITKSQVGLSDVVNVLQYSASNPNFGTATPLMDGTGAVGTATTYARSDHRHPTDTSRASTAVATTSANGLMSSADKSKLDGIASGANNYTLPTASSSTLGGVKTTSTVTSATGYTACPIISGVPYYKDTTPTFTYNSTTKTLTIS